MNIKNFSLSKIGSEDLFLYQKVKACILGHKKLLLAYSGGLDSTVLLDILTNLIKGIISLEKSFFSVFLKAIYVHHGISNQSDIWARHCKEQCKIRNVPFDIIYINCLDFCKKNYNLESEARNLRYKGLCSCLSADEVLLTAHHIDDQLETVLLALKRGSGPAGLSGIHKDIVLYDQYKLLRPLLECSRVQLQKYAKRRKLTWVEDDTNIDIRFDRNFLRTQVIPVLQERWSSFNTVVARTAQLCRNQENLLHELLSESVHKLIDADGVLFFYPLLKYSSIKRQAILRLWLKKFFMNIPSYQLLNRIWNEVVLSKSDANPVLCLNKHICRRFHKKLYILPIDMGVSINISKLSWNWYNNSALLLPGKLGVLISQELIVNRIFFEKKENLSINKDFLLNVFAGYFKISGKIVSNCLIRSPNVSEKISIQFGNVNGLLYILNRNRGRKLKKIWQELCIPPWLRNRIPLLFYDNILIAAIGVFITKEGQVLRQDIQKIDEDYMIRRIFWLQDSVYSNFFRNVVRYFLM